VIDSSVVAFAAFAFVFAAFVFTCVPVDTVVDVPVSSANA
jgi:hypothetical protein